MAAAHSDTAPQRALQHGAAQNARDVQLQWLAVTQQAQARRLPDKLVRNQVAECNALSSPACTITATGDNSSSGRGRGGLQWQAALWGVQQQWTAMAARAAARRSVADMGT